MKKPVRFSILLLSLSLLACALLPGSLGATPLPPQMQTATAVWATPGCNLRSLTSGAVWQGQGVESLLGILSLTNASSNPCRLNGTPVLEISDSGGQILPAQLAVSPTGFEPAAFVLQPGQEASTSLSWSNWCAFEPLGGLSFRLTLPGYEGFIDFPVEDSTGMSLDAVPQCTNPNEFSLLTIEPLLPLE